MPRFPYTLTGPIGHKATLGLIVLQVDETVEQDMRRVFADPGIATYVSRIPSGAELTPDTIDQMRLDLPRATALLPPAAQFDVIAYACTSGTTLIGADQVAGLIRGAAQTRAVTNPLTATLAALQHLNVSRIGLVSPYIASVADPMRHSFATHGIAVPQRLSFGEEVEARVARIDPGSIHAAALQVGQPDEVEAVFLSCTNLRTLDIIEDLEQQLGKPVLSSNQALAWHMAHLAGLRQIRGDSPGALFRSDA